MSFFSKKTVFAQVGEQSIEKIQQKYSGNNLYVIVPNDPLSKKISQIVRHILESPAFK